MFVSVCTRADFNPDENGVDTTAGKNNPGTNRSSEKAVFTTSFEDSVAILKKKIRQKKDKIQKFENEEQEYVHKIEALIKIVEKENNLISVLESARQDQLTKIAAANKNENVNMREHGAGTNNLPFLNEQEGNPEIDDFKTFFNNQEQQHKADRVLGLDDFDDLDIDSKDKFAWKDVQLNDIKYEIKEDKLLVSLFLRFNCSEFFSEGRKTLLMTRDSLDWKIVKENYATINKNNIKPLLIDFVKDWQRAWESRNIDNYIEYYSIDFQSGSYNKQSWYKDKKNKFDAAEQIAVATSNYKIKSNQKYTWTITFNQVYESDVYSDRGNKSLIIQGKPGNLRIIGEKWWR